MARALPMKRHLISLAMLLCTAVVAGPDLHAQQVLPNTLHRIATTATREDELRSSTRSSEQHQARWPKYAAWGAVAGAATVLTIIVVEQIRHEDRGDGDMLFLTTVVMGPAGTIVGGLVGGAIGVLLDRRERPRAASAPSRLYWGAQATF